MTSAFILFTTQLLIASMLLSPEISIMQTSIRDVTIRLDDILITVMVLNWLSYMAVAKDVGFATKNSLNKPILMYIIFAMLSTLLGVLRGDINILVSAFFLLKMIEFFFLFFIIVNYTSDEETINKFVTAMLVVFFIICLYGLFQLSIGERVSAPFEGAKPEKNTLGGYLAFMGGVAGGIILNTDSKVEQRIIAVFMAIMFAVLLYSFSRSGWVSVVVVILSLSYYSKKKNIYFIMIVLALLFLPYWIPEDILGRMKYTFVERAGRHGQVAIAGITFDPSSSARLIVWNNFLVNFTARPFLGYGVKGYGFVDGQYILILAEMGLVGMSIFLWLIYSIRNEIKRATKLKLSPRLHGLTIGVMAGFNGILAHALTANSFIIIRIAEPFWFLIAIIVVLNNISDKKVLQKS